MSRINSESSSQSDAPMAQELMQQERMTRHLSDLVAQAEAQAAAERAEERAERREQQHQMNQAMNDLIAVSRLMAEGNERARAQMETLQSEVKTLRAAILLAHSIGREQNGQSPLGLDVATGDASDPFQIPASSSSYSKSAAKTQSGAKRTRNLSPEARARISAAQKARWAAHRQERGQA